MLFLPRERRRALLTVYAFCRQTDDIVDAPAGSHSDVLNRLDEWEDGFRNALQGNAEDRVLSETAEVAKRYEIPSVHFEELIEGVRSDASRKSFETEAELADYCRQVAGSVGLMAIRIMGTHSAEAQAYAVRLGEAMQLTNILRDFREDSRMGRVYFPNGLLIRHGLRPDTILHSPDVGRLVSMFESVCQYVQSMYDEADGLYTQCQSRYLLPARCMQKIYEAIFRCIQQDPERILRERVRISVWNRIGIVGLETIREWRRR